MSVAVSATAIPVRGRRREVLAGVARHDRQGRVRPGQGSALRQLHGALRLRAERGARDDGLAARVDPGGGRVMTWPASPAELKRLPAESLPELAEGIRAALVDAVCRTGGHLGPNLGVVELTIALHRVFESPRDVLLWDTGHQAYVHKTLTVRLASFATLRQAGGLSGYPSRAESEHDWI